MKAKKQLSQALCEKLRLATFGDTVHVYSIDIEDTILGDLRKKIQADGDAIQFADGSVEFYRDEVLVDTTRDGSDRYTWDKAGQKMKHERIRYVIAQGGEVKSRTVIRTIYKSW